MPITIQADTIVAVAFFIVACFGGFYIAGKEKGHQEAHEEAEIRVRAILKSRGRR